MIESARSGILQNDKKTVALVPKINFGMVTPELLENFAAVARKYSIPTLKITSAQRIALVGVDPDDVENVWADLGLEPGHALSDGINYIQACPGNTVCRLGQRDSLAIAERLDKAVMPLGITAKVKIGVSGCPLSCGEGIIRDIGLFGKRATGWTITVGGNSSINARFGDILAKDLEDDAAIDLIVRFLNYYKANGKAKERLYRFVPRIGIDVIKSELGLEQ